MTQLYAGGSHDLFLRKIFFTSVGPIDVNWHYYDCLTQQPVVAYAHGLTGLVPNPYFGSIFDSKRGATFFLLMNKGSTWHGIQSVDRQGHLSSAWRAHYFHNYAP